MPLRKRLSVSLTILAIFFAIGVAMGVESRIKGKLPPLEDVFAKLFSSTVRIFDLEQLKKEHSLLSEEERAAMASFLGKDRWAKVVEGLDDAKKKFLTGEYEKYMGKPEAAAKFRKCLPRILAINANLMTSEQVRKSLASLNEKEMGVLTFSMGNDGLKVLFTNADRPKHMDILVSTPDWVILEMGLKEYDAVKDYTAVLLKNERIGGKMQGVETIELKYRVKPMSIYAKWIDGPFKGREALYNETVSTKNLRVREGGALGVMPVTVPVDSAIAKRGTNHLITEIGLGYILDLILSEYLKASPVGDITRKDIGIEEVDGKSVFVMDTILKKNPKQEYYCHRLRHYIDYTDSFEVKVEVFDWDNKMFETYTYLKIRENVGLTNADFDQNNPNYKLK